MFRGWSAEGVTWLAAGIRSVDAAGVGVVRAGTQTLSPSRRGAARFRLPGSAWSSKPPAARMAESILLALMASGMNGQQFAFHGYLPVKPDARTAAIRRLEADCFIGATRSHVGKLLCLTDIHDDIFIAGVLSDHHPLIDMGTRLDEECDAVLQLEHRIGGRDSVFELDHSPLVPGGEVALVRFVPVEVVVKDAGSLGIRHEL